MKRTKWLTMMLAIVMVASIGLAGCGGGTSDEQGNGTTGTDTTAAEFHYYTSDEPYLDPQAAQYANSLEIMNNIYEGLLRIGPDQKIQPAMAEEMPTVSEDGLTWTFKIRDAKWSDGTPITAKDFEYGITRATDESLGSIYAFIVTDYVKDVVAKDDKTLEITLKKSIPYFESLLTFATYYPAKQEFVEQAGETYGKDLNTLLFNGPFKVSTWDHDQQLTLEKNGNYWDADNVKINRVTIPIIKDDTAALNSYLAGELDYVRLSSQDVELYKDKPEFFSYEEPTLYYFMFNMENSVLDNQHIRKAITYAMDRENLVKVTLNNGSVPARSFVPKGMPGPEGKTFREVNGDLVDYDMEKAQQELKLGLEQLKMDKLPTIRLLSYDTSTTALQISEFLKENYRKLGIELQIDNLPVAAVKEKRKSGDFDLFLGGWGPDYWDAMTFLDLFVTDGTFNEGKYSNKQFDELINSAKSTSDFASRMNSMLEAEKIIVQEDPSIAPIYFRGRSVLLNPKINNFAIHQYGADSSWKWITVGE